jgi:hypothetical protein
MIFEPIACSAQTVHQSFVEISTILKETKTSFHLTHITYEFHRLPKTIFVPILYYCQSVHQSCTEIKTISKQTKMSFDLTHVT